MAAYPGAFWAGNTRGANLNDPDVHTKWHDDVQNEVKAMQQEMGLNPSGAAATIAARFTALDTTVGGKANLTGATFTGNVGGTTASFSGQVSLNVGDPTANAHAARKLYVDNADALRALKAGDTFTGIVQVGGNAVSVAGAMLRPDGVMLNCVTNTAGSVAATNSWAPNREGLAAGQPGDIGGNFVTWQRAGVGIGSVRIVAGPGVAYNTTSDYRLKKDLGPVKGALDTIAKLRPFRGHWKGDKSKQEQIMMMAHETADVTPWVVMGEKDAKDEKGKPEYQQDDKSKLVPLLVAGIQELKTRVEDLEAAK